MFEQGRFPRHKVCGEFVSPESLALLCSMLADDIALLDQAPRIAAARIFLDHRELHAPVNPPAASIPRFELDLALWHAAEAAGVDARLQIPVRKLSGSGPFVVETSLGALQARSVIQAAGRWSNLSPRWNSGTQQKWLGIKAHFHEPSPAASVDLYFFDGGYCGVQPVGTDRINVSAMVRADRATTLNRVFELHQELRTRSLKWLPASEPVSTSPLLFRSPEPLRGNVLLAGDAAGFIDPFVGDGIALALRSGAAAAQALLPFWRGEISLPAAALAYGQTYEQNFVPIFRNAARFRRLLTLPALVRAPFVSMFQRTGLPAFVVRATRGSSP
jgi:flavin-dependent dehydrogenase